ncbi:Xre family transcriptional regulator [Roseimicrobium gellanilyticum]|uniref:Xre family transcriptional regulator n=1 Tax=Roseimicrobium gellanilyticum TaxID=748857 RepID=A0A366HI62_9BACT|nr:helix-turn-helix transcriptional regulator [Roseimicrobium gellanilyticum]RBP42401.1 Xre family transcriptional regulator [Roseimicrobium gellanilyticum]
MKNRLKVLRAERGWTQEDLSKQLGVSRQAVNALETEKHSPSLDLAYRISALFGLGTEEIFENPYEVSAPKNVIGPPSNAPAG